MSKENTMKREATRIPSPTVRHVLCFAALAMLAACDFEVTNPGPTEDRFLNDAPEAVAHGAHMTHSQAMWRLVSHSALVAFEATQSANSHPHRFDLSEPYALLTPQNVVGANWNFAQRARWVAEDGVRRLTEGEEGQTSPSEPLALLYLWAGYSNRLLGETHCEAVIDGGEVEPHTVFLERAEDAFTSAMQVASAVGNPEIETAAQAGRASVRATLGDWPGAVADATGVPNDFVWETRFGRDEVAHFNQFYWANSNSPHRVYSAWDTFFEDYFLDTGDPRAAWSLIEGAEVGDTGPFLPWYRPDKYTSEDTPVRLSSGHEMRLIEAEAALVAGNWQDAMALVNELRSTVISVNTGEPVPLREASNEEEAWTALKRERGIELWLEARRLSDLRRWIENNVPGEMEDMSERSICFPIPDSERETNPNVPLWTGN